MKEIYVRRNQILNIIGAYNELKGMYMSFIVAFPEAIQGNEYGVTSRVIDDMAVEVSFIGSRLDTSFDYLITNDDVFGVLKCDEILSADLRETLLTIYFDRDGRIYRFLGDSNFSYTINQYFEKRLVFLICDAVLVRHTQQAAETN